MPSNWCVSVTGVYLKEIAGEQKRLFDSFFGKRKKECPPGEGYHGIYQTIKTVKEQMNLLGARCAPAKKPGGNGIRCGTLRAAFPTK